MNFQEHFEDVLAHGGPPQPTYTDPDLKYKLILVVGSENSEKTQFLKKFCPCTDESFRSQSHLRDVRLFGRVFRGQALVFLDTPELTDVAGNNVNALKTITETLIRCFRASIQIAGILYLSGSVDASLIIPIQAFLDLCGTEWTQRMLIIAPPEADDDNHRHPWERPRLGQDLPVQLERCCRDGATVMSNKSKRDTPVAIFDAIWNWSEESLLFQVQEEYRRGKSMLKDTSGGHTFEQLLTLREQSLNDFLNTPQANISTNTMEGMSREREHMLDQLRALAVSSPISGEDVRARDRYFKDFEWIYTARIGEANLASRSGEYERLEEGERKQRIRTSYAHMKALLAVQDVGTKLAVALT